MATSASFVVAKLRCGNCEAPLPATAVSDGQAVWRGEALICQACCETTRHAMSEALAAADLPPGLTPFDCAQCGSSLPLKALYETPVAYFQGSLYCGRCRIELVSVIRSFDDTQSISIPSLNELKNAWGFCESCGQGISETDAKTRRAGRREGHLLCSSCSQRFEALRKETEETLTSLPTQLTFPCGSCSTSVSLRDLMIERGGQRDGTILCTTCLDPGSTSQEAAQAPIPSSLPPFASLSLTPPSTTPCTNCGHNLTSADLASKQTLSIGDAVFCHRCTDEARSLTRETDAFLRHLHSSRLSCSQCDAHCHLDEAERLGFIFQGEQIFCPDCWSKALDDKRDELRSTGVLQAISFEEELAASSSSEVDAGPARTCSLCERPGVPGEQVPKGWLRMESFEFCGECRVEAESMLSSAHDAVQTAVPSCSGCGSNIEADEYLSRRIAKKDGKVYCWVCAASLEQVLEQSRADHLQDLNPCLGCGSRIDDEARRRGDTVLFRSKVFCGGCRSVVEELREETERLARRLAGSAFACSECRGPVTARELDATLALAWHNQVWCPRCRGGIYDAIRAFRQAQINPSTAPASISPLPTRSCGSCNTALASEDSVADQFDSFVFCHHCTPHLQDLRRETMIAGRIPHTNGMRCFECRERVPWEGLQSQSAVSYKGRLYCSRCRSAAFERLGRGADLDSCRACGSDQVVQNMRLRDWIFCRNCAQGSIQDLLRESTTLQIDAHQGPSSCSKCSCSISEDHLQSGTAIRHRGRLFCHTCSEPLILAASYTARRRHEELGDQPLARSGIATAGQSGIAAADRSGIRRTTGFRSTVKEDLSWSLPATLFPTPPRILLSAGGETFSGIRWTLLALAAGLLLLWWSPFASTPHRSRRRTRQRVASTQAPHATKTPETVNAPPRRRRQPLRVPPARRPAPTDEDSEIGMAGHILAASGRWRAAMAAGGPAAVGALTWHRFQNSRPEPPPASRQPAATAATRQQQAAPPHARQKRQASPIPTRRVTLQLSGRREPGGTVVVAGSLATAQPCVVNLLLIAAGTSVVDRASLPVAGGWYMHRFGPYANGLPASGLSVEALLHSAGLEGGARGAVADAPTPKQHMHRVWPTVPAPGVPFSARSASWRHEKRPLRTGRWHQLVLEISGRVSVEQPPLRLTANDDPDPPVMMKVTIQTARVLREFTDTRGRYLGARQDRGAERQLTGKPLTFAARPGEARAWAAPARQHGLDPAILSSLARTLGFALPSSQTTDLPLRSSRQIEPDLDLVGTWQPTGVNEETGSSRHRASLKVITTSRPDSSSLGQIRLLTASRTRDRISRSGSNGAPAPPRAVTVSERIHYTRAMDTEDDVVFLEREVWLSSEDHFETLEATPEAPGESQ